MDRFVVHPSSESELMDFIVLVGAVCLGIPFLQAFYSSVLLKLKLYKSSSILFSRSFRCVFLQCPFCIVFPSSTPTTDYRFSIPERSSDPLRIYVVLENESEFRNPAPDPLGVFKVAELLVSRSQISLFKRT